MVRWFTEARRRRIDWVGVTLVIMAVEGFAAALFMASRGCF